MQEKYELEQLMELVQTKQFRKLRAILMEMNEVDIAEFLDELGPEETVLVFRLLPKELAAEVFTELEDSDDQERLINALSDKELREVLDELYLDDTVDVIEDMPANVVSRILRNSDPASRSQINQLLNYPKDSAGSIMTTEYVFLHPDATHGVCVPPPGRHGGGVLCPHPQGGHGQGDHLHLLCHPEPGAAGGSHREAAAPVQL